MTLSLWNSGIFVVDFFVSLAYAFSMKFSISLDQRNHLHTNGFITFYDLLSEKEVNSLQLGLAESVKNPKQTRDLWRSNQLIKQIVCSRRLVNLAFQLIQKKPIRLAFDQYLPEQKENFRDQTQSKWSCSQYFGTDFCFSVSSLVGMLLLSLNSENKGEGYFILPSTPFEKLPLTPNQSYFLICYCDMHSQYLLENKDPETHFLKSIGYVFGDKLNDREHPILLR